MSSGCRLFTRTARPPSSTRRRWSPRATLMTTYVPWAATKQLSQGFVPEVLVVVGARAVALCVVADLGCARGLGGYTRGLARPPLALPRSRRAWTPSATRSCGKRRRQAARRTRRARHARSSCMPRPAPLPPLSRAAARAPHEEGRSRALIHRLVPNGETRAAPSAIGPACRSRRSPSASSSSTKRSARSSWR